MVKVENNANFFASAVIGLIVLASNNICNLPKAAFIFALNFNVTCAPSVVSYKYRRYKPHVYHRPIISFISDIVCIIYERRLGSFSESPKPEIRKFIKSVNDMFELTEYFAAMPPFLYNVVARKRWKQFDDAWGYIYDFSA